MLKKGDSVLLAAKILALSRHLHTKISTNPMALGYVDTVRSRLGRLRQKLLTNIDRRLVNLNIESDGLVDAMCAYSLATSSSCTEILRHFHHIRLDSISATFQKVKVQSSDALHSLELWARTMRDTQSIFPRQLSNALAKLRAHPILKDVAIRSIIEFDLDVHEDWIGDDIRNFVPYVRHDDLTVAMAAQMLSSWAPSALKTMLAGLNNFLVSIDDLEAIIELRYDSLKLWFPNHAFVIGITRREVLDALRKIFQQRLLDLVKTQCETISDIVSLVEMTIGQWNSNLGKKAVASLWSEETACMDISHGVEPFTKALTASVYGKTDTVLATTKRYRHWLQKVEDLRHTISGLRKNKWDDDDIDSDEDDEDSHSVRQNLLSEEDPEILQQHLNDCLDHSFLSLSGSLQAITKELEDSVDSESKASYLLRIIREIKQQFLSDPHSAKFDSSHAVSLHRIIARPIVQNVLKDHQAIVLKSISSLELPGRSLWDGSPELPVLPSPWSFKILRVIELELGKTGSDLWTSTAIYELKMLLRAEIASLISQATSQEVAKKDLPIGDATDKEATTSQGSKTEMDGDKPRISPPQLPGDFEAQTSDRDSLIQTLFDLEYLDAATLSPTLHSAAQAIDGFSHCRDELRQRLALTQALGKRVEKGAAEYWKRTWLLFALLG